MKVGSVFRVDATSPPGTAVDRLNGLTTPESGSIHPLLCLQPSMLLLLLLLLPAVAPTAPAAAVLLLLLLLLPFLLLLPCCCRCCCCCCCCCCCPCCCCFCFLYLFLVGFHQCEYATDAIVGSFAPEEMISCQCFGKSDFPNCAR